ncbi:MULTISPECIES: hypothetical protein [unclassified Streptomyces]
MTRAEKDGGRPAAFLTCRAPAPRLHALGLDMRVTVLACATTAPAPAG